MNTIEFLTMAYALACTIGPAMGLLSFIALLAVRRLDRRGFSITLGIPGRGEKWRSY